MHSALLVLQVRSVRSVTVVCSDRAAALAAHVAAKHDVDTKKVRDVFNHRCVFGTASALSPQQNLIVLPQYVIVTCLGGLSLVLV